MYEIGQEEIDAVTRVLKSGQLFRYRGGENGEVSAVEKMMVEQLGCDYALAVTSGTAALICGLVGLGIGPGDEVIVPAYTWLASAGAVLSVGAIPVLAEIDATLTLDPVDFEQRIGPRTKAVMPVHMGGRPCNMDAIMTLAAKHGLKVLEDSCQAVGGSYKGRRLATIGNAGAFSFNQFKIIACGEGGVLLTSERKIFERALYYHDMGCSFREHAGHLNEEPFLGHNFRMNDLLGAVLRVQFGRLDGILERLRKRQRWLLDAVRSADSGLCVLPSNDPTGDCGTFGSFLFRSAEDRLRVAGRVRELCPEVRMDSPIDSGLHVYTNWKTLLEGRAGHHPAVNPFRLRENRDCRLEIKPTDCPKTLEILARTGAIAIGIDWTREHCEGIAASLCRAACELPREPADALRAP